MPEDAAIKLSPEPYKTSFLRNLDGHIADMKAVLRSVEDGTFVERAMTPSQGAILKITIDRNSAPEQDASHRACVKCFKEIVSDFLSFADRIIAFNRVLNHGSIRVDKPFISRDELFALITKALDDEYLRVASDRSLTGPAKIERVLRTVDGVRIAKSLVIARNCLEHRAGVPENDIELVYRRFALSTGGVEVQSFPVDVVDEKLTFDLHIERRMVHAGKKLEFTEPDIDNIAWTVRLLATEIVEVELKGG